jgi:hypothetical protein
MFHCCAHLILEPVPDIPGLSPVQGTMFKSSRSLNRVWGSAWGSSLELMSCHRSTNYDRMSHPLRIQFSTAFYHAMNRGQSCVRFHFRTGEIRDVVD